MNSFFQSPELIAVAIGIAGGLLGLAKVLVDARFGSMNHEITELRLEVEQLTTIITVKTSERDIIKGDFDRSQASLVTAQAALIAAQTELLACQRTNNTLERAAAALDNRLSAKANAREER